MKHCAPALAALLLASACGHSSGDTSQSATSTSSYSADAAPGSLEGIRRRVPVYSSNLTSAPELISPGVYQFQTSDSVSTVLAWYKSHIPGNLGGAWKSLPGPADDPDWYYEIGRPTDSGAFAVGMQHPNPNLGNQYAPGTKAVVEVTDR